MIKSLICLIKCHDRFMTGLFAGYVMGILALGLCLRFMGVL